jgi:nicotinamidase-related amidase
MNINKSNSAVVLIEFQNQWTEKGFFHGLIKEQLKSRNVLENTYTLVEKAREMGMKIIHAPLIIDPKKKKGWFAYLTFGKIFTKDTWKSEITDGLYEEGDITAKGRYSFDAFVGSDLEQLLKDNRIENVFLCGFTTDQCVAKTMKTALEKGFNCHVVSDCTATRNSSLQKKTEKSFRGKVVNHLEVLDMAN